MSDGLVEVEKVVGVTEKVNGFWGEVVKKLEEVSVEEGDVDWGWVKEKLSGVDWVQSGEGVLDGKDKDGNNWAGHLKTREIGDVTIYEADFSKGSESFEGNKGKVSVFMSKRDGEILQTTVNSNLVKNGINPNMRTWEYSGLKLN